MITFESILDTLDVETEEDSLFPPDIEPVPELEILDQGPTFTSRKSNSVCVFCFNPIAIKFILADSWEEVLDCYYCIKCGLKYEHLPK